MITSVRLPNITNEYLNNTKVVTYLSTNKTSFENTLKLTTIPKKDIFITVDLAADKNLHLTNPNITVFDKAVMDSVYTLFVYGETTFTPEMIVRIMTGNRLQDVRKRKAQDVTDSLIKLSLIRITIDCTDEFRTRNLISKNREVKLTSYVMPVREIEVLSANHKTVMKGFQLLEKPVLYSYAEQVNQIISVPTSILATNKIISDTNDNIILKRSLIQRIETMKNTKNKIKSKSIIYERTDKETRKTKGFFESLGFIEENYSNWKKKKNNLHKSIISILDCFKEENYIKSYEIIKKGKQKILGISVDV